MMQIYPDFFLSQRKSVQFTSSVYQSFVIYGVNSLF